ncbi:hypothetical protein TNCV_4049911 [Trichonephila clavipes]|nr:hypothetical protein TNCV_4049911 [Trichonephila clavipes]
MSKLGARAPTRDRCVISSSRSVIEERRVERLPKLNVSAWCGSEEKLVVAQVSLSLLAQCSKLREPSPKGCGSPVVKVLDHGRHVMSSIQVPLKAHCLGERCTLNLSRARTPSRWCGVVVRRGGASSDVILVT